MAKMEQNKTLSQWFCWLASTQVAFIESINLPFPQKRLLFRGSSMRREPIILPVTNYHPLTPLHDFQKNVISLVFSCNRQMRKPIEMGLGFCLILPATLRSPKNQNVTTPKDACCRETFISADWAGNVSSVGFPRTFARLSVPAGLCAHAGW